MIITGYDFERNGGMNLILKSLVSGDIRYDNFYITGGGGLFLDRRAIGADWRFVGEELSIATNSYVVYSMSTRLKAAGLAFGLGVAATSKT